jgi:hypothetical protein
VKEFAMSLVRACIYFLGVFAAAFLLTTSGVVAQDIDEDTFEETVVEPAEATDPAVEADESLADDIGDDASELQPWEQWEYLVGAFIVPLLTGAAIFRNFTVAQKNGILALVTLATTAVGLFLQGDFTDVSDWPSTFISLLMAAFVSYNTIGRFIQIPQWIESKTGGDPMTGRVLNLRP